MQKWGDKETRIKRYIEGDLLVMVGIYINFSNTFENQQVFYQQDLQMGDVVAKRVYEKK